MLDGCWFLHSPSYTLIETAKLNGVDPNAWLADTLESIPDYKITKVDELMPWRWNRKRSDRTVTAVMPAKLCANRHRGGIGLSLLGSPK